MKIAIAALALLFVTACSGASHGERQATPQPQPTLLAQSRGVVVPLSAAVRQIAFRPVIPGAQIAAVALIPPLGGADSRKTHGLAIEYASGGNALLLSQWPRPGFALTVNGVDLTASPCAPVAYKTDGLLWATRNGLVMTLQPDGTAPPSRVAREAQQLIADGACGSAARTSPRRSRTRIPAVSLPRQSVS